METKVLNFVVVPSGEKSANVKADGYGFYVPVSWKQPEDKSMMINMAKAAIRMKLNFDG